MMDADQMNDVYYNSNVPNVTKRNKHYTTVSKIIMAIHVTPKQWKSLWLQITVQLLDLGHLNKINQSFETVIESKKWLIFS